MNVAFAAAVAALGFAGAAWTQSPLQTAYADRDRLLKDKNERQADLQLLDQAKERINAYDAEIKRNTDELRPVVTEWIRAYGIAYDHDAVKVAQETSAQSVDHSPEQVKSAGGGSCGWFAMQFCLDALKAVNDKRKAVYDRFAAIDREIAGDVGQSGRIGMHNIREIARPVDAPHDASLAVNTLADLRAAEAETRSRVQSRLAAIQTQLDRLQAQIAQLEAEARRTTAQAAPPAPPQAPVQRTGPAQPPNSSQIQATADLRDLVEQEEGALNTLRAQAAAACQDAATKAGKASEELAGARAVVGMMRAQLDQFRPLAADCSKTAAANGNLDAVYLIIGLARATAEECHDATDAGLARNLYEGGRSRIQRLAATAANAQSNEVGQARAIVSGLTAVLGENDAAIAAAARARTAIAGAAAALQTADAQRAALGARRDSYQKMFNDKRAALSGALPAELASVVAAAEQKQAQIGAVSACNASVPDGSPIDALVGQANGIVTEATRAKAACQDAASTDKMDALASLFASQQAEVEAKVRACEAKWRTDTSVTQNQQPAGGGFAANGPSRDGPAGGAGDGQGVQQTTNNNAGSQTFGPAGPPRDQLANDSNSQSGQQTATTTTSGLGFGPAGPPRDQPADSSNASLLGVTTDNASLRNSLNQSLDNAANNMMAPPANIPSQPSDLPMPVTQQQYPGGPSPVPDARQQSLVPEFQLPQAPNTADDRAARVAAALQVFQNGMEQIRQQMQTPSPNANWPQLPPATTLPNMGTPNFNLPQVSPLPGSQPGNQTNASRGGSPAKPPAPAAGGQDCDKKFCPDCGASSQVSLLGADSTLWCQRCKREHAGDIAACNGSTVPASNWNPGGKNSCVYMTPEAWERTRAAFAAGRLPDYSGLTVYEIVDCDKPYRGGVTGLQYGPETAENCRLWLANRSGRK